MSATASHEIKARPFSVRVMTVGDCEEVLTLFDATLGDGYVALADLREHARQGSKTACVAVGPDGTVLAAATGLLPDGSRWLSAVPDDQQDRAAAVLPEFLGSTVGILKSVAVADEARGMGVATALSAATVAVLARWGAAYALSIGWTDADGCHIQRTLERLGFAARADVEDFWLAESEKDGYGCPTCGHPCRCTARLFSRSLAQSAAGQP